MFLNQMWATGVVFQLEGPPVLLYCIFRKDWGYILNVQTTYSLFKVNKKAFHYL